MKLISEEIQNAEMLVEETNGKKNYKIKGVSPPKTSTTFAMDDTFELPG